MYVSYSVHGDYDMALKVIDSQFVCIQGNDQAILLRTKTSGDSLGELALMYDTKRNVTAKATTDALLWAVNRAEFKSILARHLSGSPIAQVWLKSMSLIQKLEF